MASQGGGVQGSVSVQCTGQTSGTLTKAKATLSLNVEQDGRAEGSFVNNGTLFRAVGVVPGRRTPAGTYTIDSVDLQLDSRLTGGLNGVAGTQPVGLAVAYGSTGLLTGKVGLDGQFRGIFRGVQGNYAAEMTCTS